MKIKKDIDWVAYVLMTIGALNWGLKALGLDLIETILGTNADLVKFVYLLIGASGVYSLYKMTTMQK